MDLDKYQELTGITVATGDVARYNATINRVNASLESALGYSLDPTKNLDNTELGKVQFEGQSPYYPIDFGTLLPPDTATGTFRLYPYNENDKYLKADPFSNLYHVKLVQSQNNDEFVTFVDLNDYTSKRARQFSKYVEKQDNWFTWSWYTWLQDVMGADNGLMVAIDGDWMTQYNAPDDIMYLWADMVTYYASDEVSVTGNIKSESVNGHSWSKTNAGGGKGGDLTPDQSQAGLTTIAQYAGPNGTQATRVPTI